jgi:hypothetical protein
MNKHGRIDYKSSYFTMISPINRNTIINNINTINNYEFTETNRNNNKDLWITKHHPEKIIPERIYLLGNGYFSELYLNYSNKYNFEIIEKEFKNYLRELIYQGICIENKK